MIGHENIFRVDDDVLKVRIDDVHFHYSHCVYCHIIMPSTRRQAAKKGTSARRVKGGESIRPPVSSLTEQPIPALPDYGDDEAKLVDTEVQELETEESAQPLLASQIQELQQLRALHANELHRAHGELQRAFQVVQCGQCKT